MLSGIEIFNFFVSDHLKYLRFSLVLRILSVVSMCATLFTELRSELRSTN